MIAKKTDNNDDIWLKEKGNRTYVIQQNMFAVIDTYDKNYLQKAKDKPPYDVEQYILRGSIAFHLWYGKDYWFISREEAIQFLRDIWR